MRKKGDQEQSDWKEHHWIKLVEVGGY